MLEPRTELSQPPVEIISHADKLETAAREMAGSKALALDTESNSAHRYPEQLCLIQIATLDKVYLIDTISLPDISPLSPILGDSSVMKVIHGADYDVRCLDRHCGFHIRNLYDTSVAARFAGIAKFGLADLIKDLLGISILKSERLQRADWGQRPLSVEALEYAAADVHHLFALQEILDARLKAMDRVSWVAEECARVAEARYTVPNLETAFLSVKGSQGLDPHGLAVLKSLYLFRHEEATRQHRPPFFVIQDSSLTFLAANTGTDIAEVPGLGQYGAQRYGRGLGQALRHGIQSPPVHRPPVDIVSRSQIQRLSALKAWRESLGVTLALDPSLLWPTVSLERLARAPGSLDSEINSGSVRAWQRARFGESLAACMNSLKP